MLDSLSTNQMRTPALIQPYTWLDDRAPDAVSNVRVEKTRDTRTLLWNAPLTTDPMQQAVRYVVYRFAAGQPVNIDDAPSIVAITGEPCLLLPPAKDKKNRGTWQYAVTAVDRCNNESAPTVLTVKL